MAEHITQHQLQPLRRVLCATDLSARSDAALCRAAALAQHAGARLAVVHAISNQRSARIARLQVNRAYAQMLSRLEELFGSELDSVDVIVRAGHPRQVIMDAANEADADLVVMAAPRAGRFDWIVGTTAERLIRAIKRPVLIVHRDARDAYRHIAIATDLSNFSLAMLRTAVGLGVLDRAYATVIHAQQPPYDHKMRAAGIDEQTIDRYRQSHRDDIVQRLESMLSSAGLAPNRTRVTVRTDPPEVAIPEALKHEQPELLAIGASRWFLLKRLFIGSVADLLLRTAMCDLLVIPHRPERMIVTPHPRRASRGVARANGQAREPTHAAEFSSV